MSTPLPEDRADVNPWTRRWWESLPRHYRTADREQNPEIGGVPLLRFMDGVGEMAGRIRQISDDLYNGAYTDPVRVPDRALPWLAFLMGMEQGQRLQHPRILRQRLQALITAGRTRVGTRQVIAESAKEFMVEGAQARVTPHRTLPHTLVLHVRADDVLNDDVENLAANVQSAGFVPAGHVVVINTVISTWDSWESAAGETWDDKERNIQTWAQSDSAGVELE
ncbi:phage tail protein [Nesterenkonia rhizosphaerae]|uniref:Uncharacterized protein n=1 Tax=Nesterenkonia rhizosphaerae TaxID=1348272 RepID=A0ABP9FWP8_9MICC